VGLILVVPVYYESIKRELKRRFIYESVSIGAMKEKNIPKNMKKN
jgi:hypothetical protein